MTNTKTSEAQKKATAKWQRDNTTSFNVRLHNKNDADVIARLREKGVVPYIKRLIREDIAKEKAIENK